MSNVEFGNIEYPQIVSRSEWLNVRKDLLFVNCEIHAEVDDLWEKLSEGGEKVRLA